jgi:hypothetical protein
MILKLLRVAFVAGAAALGCGLLAGDAGRVQAGDQQHVAPDLFYNFYVPPGNCGAPGAQLYVSPLPTPPYVGHTYITYQPLLPNEFLYQHCRTYHTEHPNGTWTNTHVIWGHTYGLRDAWIKCSDAHPWP